MNNIDKRKRLQSRLDDYKREYVAIMRGKVVPTQRALTLQRKMDEINNEISQIQTREAERIALANSPIDEVLEVIAIPLLADVMNDFVARVDGMLRRKGCQETVFASYVADIRRASLAMIDTLDHAKEGLPKLLDVDDTLVDALRKKLLSFIKQHTNITK